MKYKEDMRLKREEVKELRAVLVQEREYNVQTNHSMSRLQEMKSLQDTQVCYIVNQALKVLSI